MSLPCRVLYSRKCEITDRFDLPRHGGVDLVKEGYTVDYVIAHSEGEVVEVRKDCKGYEGNGSYGNYVKLKHKNGYYTLYAHLCYDTIPVSVGDHVNESEYIGYMGSTGYSEASHLHFEVRNTSDVRVDPEPYLNSNLPNIITITDNVEKDINKDQVEVLYNDLHVRVLPSLEGDILGFAHIGYYNVLEITENDGYKWFKIGDDNYIAYSEDWAVYYPKTYLDYKKLFDELLEKYEDLIVKYEKSINTNNELNEKINKAIEDLS